MLLLQAPIKNLAKIEHIRSLFAMSSTHLMNAYLHHHSLTFKLAIVRLDFIRHAAKSTDVRGLTIQCLH
jgi:hypothetical protein